MTAYEIIAWCDRTFYTRFKVDAESPEQALEIGKVQVEDEPAEECDDGYHWDTFSVCDADDNTLLTHQDDQARLRESAPKLLVALEDAREWISTGEVDGVHFDEGMVLDSIDTAIAQATSGPIVPPVPIVIKVRGGCVVEVTGLPPGYLYELQDHDPK